MIDTPIISSLPPLPPAIAAENTDVVAHLEALDGRGSSDKTMTGSETLRAQSVTPPPILVGLGQAEQDNREVTPAARESSSRTGVPTP